MFLIPGGLLNMKHLILVGSCLFLSNAWALDIQPGLWEIKSEIVVHGKSFDPMAAMKTAMDNLPEEQKKAIREKMADASSHVDFDDKTAFVCHTPETIKSPKSIEDSSNCKINIKTNTPRAMSGDVSCTQSVNFKGTFDLKVKDPKNYEYKMAGKGPQGTPVELRYKAKLVTAECGDHKPVK